MAPAMLERTAIRMLMPFKRPPLSRSGASQSEAVIFFVVRPSFMLQDVRTHLSTEDWRAALVQTQAWSVRSQGDWDIAVVRHSS